jgi:large subunit ribosomal protein L21
MTDICCLFQTALSKISVLLLEGDAVYAVSITGDKQYRVSEGDVVRVEELGVDSGAQVEFKEVLLVKGEDATYIGRPLVQGATVQGTVDAVGKGDKVLVFKIKRKKQYRRTRGHRQQYTAVRIDKIHVASS